MFDAQGGKCWYCQCDMILPAKGQQNPLPSNMATFEHLDKVGHIVLACHKCNNERS